jgi:hypothetical protein
VKRLSALAAKVLLEKKSATGETLSRSMNQVWFIALDVEQVRPESAN